VGGTRCGPAPPRLGLGRPLPAAPASSPVHNGEEMRSVRVTPCLPRPKWGGVYELNHTIPTYLLTTDLLELVRDSVRSCS
jgi:hypothetical protein